MSPLLFSRSSKLTVFLFFTFFEIISYKYTIYRSSQGRKSMALFCHKCIRSKRMQAGVFSLTVKALSKLEIGCPIPLTWHSLSACGGGVSFAGYVQLPYQKRRPKRRLFFRLCGFETPPYFFWSASADTLSRQTGIRI